MKISKLSKMSGKKIVELAEPTEITVQGVRVGYLLSLKTYLGMLSERDSLVTELTLLATPNAGGLDLGEGA